MLYVDVRCIYPDRRWSGVNDGKWTGRTLISRVIDDQATHEVRDRIRNTDVLLIDEVINAMCSETIKYKCLM